MLDWGQGREVEWSERLVCTENHFQQSVIETNAQLIVLPHWNIMSHTHEMIIPPTHNILTMGQPVLALPITLNKWGVAGPILKVFGMTRPGNQTRTFIRRAGALPLNHAVMVLVPQHRGLEVEHPLGMWKSSLILRPGHTKILFNGTSCSSLVQCER